MLGGVDAWGTDPWAGARAASCLLPCGPSASPENSGGCFGSEKVTCLPVTQPGMWGAPGLKAQPGGLQCCGRTPARRTSRPARPS